MKTTLDWGREYLRRGWALVLIYPVHGGACECQTDPERKGRCNNGSDRGKHPIWGTKRGAITNVYRLGERLKAWPDAGLGILTGKRSGIVVIDLDRRNVVDQAAVDRYLAELGPTRTHTTGDGKHMFARYVDGIGKFDMLPGLQVIGDGGMVVAPPSRHFKTGKTYTVNVMDVNPYAEIIAPWPDAWTIPEPKQKATGTPSGPPSSSPSYLPPGLLDAIMARAATVNGNEIIFKCAWPDNHKHGDSNPSATFNTQKGCGRCKSCGEKYGWLKLSERLGVPVHRRLSPEAVAVAAAELSRQAGAEKWHNANLRAVWLAVLAICADKGKACVGISARDLGEHRVGCCRQTASKWLGVLAELGYLELVHPSTRWSATANVYLVPGVLSHSLPTVSTTPPKGDKGTVVNKWDTLNADLFRHHGGLGKRGFELVAALDAGERFTGPRDIERRLHIPRQTAKRKLDQAAELGLAILDAGEWVRGPVTIAEASERVATAGAGDRQRERHAKDRAAYSRYLASYEKEYSEKLTPQPGQAAAAPVRAEGDAGQCGQDLASLSPDAIAAAVSFMAARHARPSTDYGCLARPSPERVAIPIRLGLNVELRAFVGLFEQKDASLAEVAA